MSSVISAAAMRCRTMADGSLRIEVEVEPSDAQQAFCMFGKPGAPVALAALKPGFAAADTEPPASGVEPQDAADAKNREMRKRMEDAPAAKGGALARLAGQWCQMPQFYVWLKHRLPRLCEEVTLALGEPDAAAEVAAEVIRQYCGVSSRAELDHSADAAATFHRAFREPFSAELKRLELA